MREIVGDMSGYLAKKSSFESSKFLVCVDQNRVAECDDVSAVARATGTGTRTPDLLPRMPPITALLRVIGLFILRTTALHFCATPCSTGFLAVLYNKEYVLLCTSSLNGSCSNVLTSLLACCSLYSRARLLQAFLFLSFPAVQGSRFCVT